MPKPVIELPIQVKTNTGLIDCTWNDEITSCRDCGASIGFALTDKNKKWIPFNAYGQNTGVVTPHWDRKTALH